MTKTVSRRRPRRFVDVVFFSWANNVWFGICTLIAIFIYSSIGSAYPPARQHPWLDMTEMEWFHWWPFDLLIALLCVTQVTVTLKQIPFRLVNAGVWLIHTGIITLCAGSVYYFGTKLEGDAPIFRRQAVIRVPGVDEPATLLIRPDNHVTVGDGANQYHFTVTQIFPDWQIASGADKGKSAMMVWVDCVTPEQRFTRQLLVGYPQYTEDILPNRTRAKKTLGKRLVDETLDMQLAFAPQTEFFLMDSASLFARKAGAKRWVERTIDDLPRYHDHIGSYDDVFLSPSAFELPLRPLDVALPPADEPGDPLAEYDVRVTAYLRYAFAATQWRDGGERLNPVARAALIAGPGARLDYGLVAFDPRRSRSENGQVQFRWVESPEAMERVVASSQGRLTIAVPGTDIRFDVPLDDVTPRGADAPFTPIEGTQIGYRLRNVAYNLVAQSGSLAGRSMSVATVEIQTPDGAFTRFVADIPGATRDMGDGREMTQPDPMIDISFEPGLDARVTLIAGPGDLPAQVLFKNTDGTTTRKTIAPGESVQATEQVRFELTDLFTHGVEEVRPRVVPREQRDRDARETFSMIRLELSKGQWSRSVWLNFNRYALPNEQYAIARRMIYDPQSVRLADGETIELIYSRQRHALPTAIALDSFSLETHAGGYTGSTITIRDFVSQLRFKTDDGWSDLMQMSSNRPASAGGFWYFQSMWDPPARGYAGMNYTGVGVGNRNGVYIQLAGTCIAVAGMLFAFYVKPMIRRRMQDRAAAARSAPGRTVEERKPLPVAVR